MKYKFEKVFPYQNSSKHDCRALYDNYFDMIFHLKAAQNLIEEHYMKTILT